MATSASTPRLRLTALFYALLVMATAIVGPAAGGSGPCAPWPPALALALSLLLVAFACLGRIWCSLYIAGRKDSQLVTEGPYALLRHPLYWLSFVGGLGLSLASGSLMLVAVTALVLGVLLVSAARTEERFLAGAHPASWPAYRSSTPALWPRLSAWSMPERLEVHPRVLWKAFVDAGAFFLLLALVLLARTLRESGQLPGIVSSMRLSW